MPPFLSAISFLCCSYFTFNGAIKHLHDVFPLDNNSVLQLFTGHERFHFRAHKETRVRTAAFSNGQSSAGVPFLGACSGMAPRVTPCNHQLRHGVMTFSPRRTLWADRVNDSSECHGVVWGKTNMADDSVNIAFGKK